MSKDKSDWTPPREVSDERLHQKSGSDNAFGGWEKHLFPNGDFRMIPTEGEK
jgi:hypothetical protein